MQPYRYLFYFVITVPCAIQMLWPTPTPAETFSGCGALPINTTPLLSFGNYRFARQGVAPYSDSHGLQLKIPILHVTMTKEVPYTQITLGTTRSASKVEVRFFYSNGMQRTNAVMIAYNTTGSADDSTIGVTEIQVDGEVDDYVISVCEGQ
jgi:hypothetical protein